MTTARPPATATPTRPGTVTAAAVLVCLAAAGTAAQLIFFVSSYRLVAGLELLTVALPSLVSALAYVATVPGMLRGRTWAQVAVTALAGVAVLSQLPRLVLLLVQGPDWLVLAYSSATLVLAAVLVLLWSRSARAWFGPVT